MRRSSSGSSRQRRPDVAEPLTPRAGEVLAVARRLLEREGAQALTMRRVADDLGIRAPSLYKHFPHKAALETAIIATGFEDAATAFETAVDGADDALTAFVAAYRGFAASHPHLYRLMTERPLPRTELPPGLEARTAAPLLRAAGTSTRARAAWAFIHGMTMLELNGRFPSDGLTEQAWEDGIAAFRGSTPTSRSTSAASRHRRSTRRGRSDAASSAYPRKGLPLPDPESA
jgi:AcrR family transcriptional regulator